MELFKCICCRKLYIIVWCNVQHMQVYQVKITTCTLYGYNNRVEMYTCNNNGWGHIFYNKHSVIFARKVRFLYTLGNVWLNPWSESSDWSWAKKQNYPIYCLSKLVIKFQTFATSSYSDNFVPIVCKL